jgi:hypothetical protein
MVLTVGQNIHARLSFSSRERWVWSAWSAWSAWMFAIPVEAADGSAVEQKLVVKTGSGTEMFALAQGEEKQVQTSAPASYTPRSALFPDLCLMLRSYYQLEPEFAIMTCSERLESKDKVEALLRENRELQRISISKIEIRHMSISPSAHCHLPRSRTHARHVIPKQQTESLPCQEPIKRFLAVRTRRCWDGC